MLTLVPSYFLEVHRFGDEDLFCACVMRFVCFCAITSKRFAPEVALKLSNVVSLEADNQFVVNRLSTQWPMNVGLLH